VGLAVNAGSVALALEAGGVDGGDAAAILRRSFHLFGRFGAASGVDGTKEFASPELTIGVTLLREPTRPTGATIEPADATGEPRWRTGQADADDVDESADRASARPLTLRLGVSTARRIDSTEPTMTSREAVRVTAV
jgi:hypothetical protein